MCERDECLRVRLTLHVYIFTKFLLVSIKKDEDLAIAEVTAREPEPPQGRATEANLVQPHQRIQSQAHARAVVRSCVASASAAPTVVVAVDDGDRRTPSESSEADSEAGGLRSVDSEVSVAVDTGEANRDRLARDPAKVGDFLPG